MKIPRPMLAIALPLALALIAAGCGGSSSDSSTGADTSESGASTAQATGTAAAGSGQTLQVSADPNGALKFSQSSLSAKSGQVTIQMSNPSSIEHGISVEGNGVDEEGQTAQPGGTATVSANLKPGTYTFYCPVDSHKQQGMTGTLTVK